MRRIACTLAACALAMGMASAEKAQGAQVIYYNGTLGATNEPYPVIFSGEYAPGKFEIEFEIFLNTNPLPLTNAYGPYGSFKVDELKNLLSISTTATITSYVSDVLYSYDGEIYGLDAAGKLVYDGQGPDGFAEGGDMYIALSQHNFSGQVDAFTTISNEIVSGYAKTTNYPTEVHGTTIVPEYADYVLYFDGQFNDKLSFRFQDSVPEPGAWVFMIAGLFGTGFELRSRRHMRSTSTDGSPCSGRNRSPPK